jgi:hypothetical protein
MSPARMTDAFGQLFDVDALDVFDRQPAERVRDAFFFFVRAGGAHDAHPRALRDLGHELDVAPEIHGTWIEKRAHAQRHQFLQAVDTARTRFIALEAWRQAVHEPARIADQQMFMNQCHPEFVGTHATGDSVDPFHSPPTIPTTAPTD